jgi:zinc protease
VTRDKAQTALAMAFPAPSRDDPDHVAFELVAGIASGLGGRFFEALRDAKSLAYTVSASPVTRRRAGMFTAYIATDPAREDEAREGLLAEFARLVDAPVGADELARAQGYALGVRAIRQQSGGVVLGEVLDAWLLGEGLDELDAWAGRIRSATPATLQRLAAQWFDPARRVEGIVRARRA